MSGVGSRWLALQRRTTTVEAETDGVGQDGGEAGVDSGLWWCRPEAEQRSLEADLRVAVGGEGGGQDPLFSFFLCLLTVLE